MKRNATSSFFDLLLILSIAGILLQVLLLSIHYTSLPGTIPIHFNWQGEADNYGSKKFLLLIFAIGAGIAAMILIFLYKARSLPVNWPGKKINADSIRTAGIRIGKLVLFFMVIAWVEIIWSTIQIARGESKGLGPVFTIGFIGAGIAITIASFWMLYKASGSQGNMEK